MGASPARRTHCRSDPAGTRESADYAGSPECAWLGCCHDRAIGRDGDVFLAYLEQVLCPKLKDEDVVILDNLSAHKVFGVRELIEAKGAAVLLPVPALSRSHRLFFLVQATMVISGSFFRPERCSRTFLEFLLLRYYPDQRRPSALRKKSFFQPTLFRPLGGT